MAADIFHVLITDRFDIDALAALKSQPRIATKISAQPLPTAQELESCDALIIRSRTKIDRALIAQAPRLKLIVSATSGFDHIDLTATRATNLAVMHTPEANAASACELTFGLLLACARKLVDAHRAVKTGDWRRDALLGTQLQGKTLGIVGLGRIGTRIARIAEAFGMKSIAFDPFLESEDFTARGASRVSLEELLRLADVVTFHVPKTTETNGMLTANHLESMNRHAILINASRGSVVTERDLIRALEENWIAALGLDVFEREPLPRDSKLISFPNVVLSPHLGATTREAFAGASREAAEKVIAFAATGAVSDPLPPLAPWFESRFF